MFSSARTASEAGLISTAGAAVSTNATAQPSSVPGSVMKDDSSKRRRHDPTLSILPHGSQKLAMTLASSKPAVIIPKLQAANSLQDAGVPHAQKLLSTLLISPLQANAFLADSLKRTLLSKVQTLHLEGRKRLLASVLPYVGVPLARDVVVALLMAIGGGGGGSVDASASGSSAAVPDVDAGVVQSLEQVPSYVWAMPTTLRRGLFRHSPSLLRAYARACVHAYSVLALQRNALASLASPSALPRVDSSFVASRIPELDSAGPVYRAFNRELTCALAEPRLAPYAAEMRLELALSLHELGYGLARNNDPLYEFVSHLGAAMASCSLDEPLQRTLQRSLEKRGQFLDVAVGLSKRLATKKQPAKPTKQAASSAPTLPDVATNVDVAACVAAPAIKSLILGAILTAISRAVEAGQVPESIESLDFLSHLALLSCAAPALAASSQLLHGSSHLYRTNSSSSSSAAAAAAAAVEAPTSLWQPSPKLLLDAVTAAAVAAEAGETKTEEGGEGEGESTVPYTSMIPPADSLALISPAACMSLKKGLYPELANLMLGSMLEEKAPAEVSLLRFLRPSAHVLHRELVATYLVQRLRAGDPVVLHQLLPTLLAMCRREGAEETEGGVLEPSLLYHSDSSSTPWGILPSLFSELQTLISVAKGKAWSYLSPTHLAKATIAASIATASPSSSSSSLSSSSSADLGPFARLARRLAPVIGASVAQDKGLAPTNPVVAQTIIASTIAAVEPVADSVFTLTAASTLSTSSSSSSSSTSYTTELARAAPLLAGHASQAISSSVGPIMEGLVLSPDHLSELLTEAALGDNLPLPIMFSPLSPSSSSAGSSSSSIPLPASASAVTSSSEVLSALESKDAFADTFAWFGVSSAGWLEAQTDAADLLINDFILPLLSLSASSTAGPAVAPLWSLQDLRAAASALRARGGAGAGASGSSTDGHVDSLQAADALEKHQHDPVLSVLVLRLVLSSAEAFDSQRMATLLLSLLRADGVQDLALALARKEPQSHASSTGSSTTSSSSSSSPPLVSPAAVSDLLARMDEWLSSEADPAALLRLVQVFRLSRIGLEVFSRSYSTLASIRPTAAAVLVAHTLVGLAWAQSVCQAAASSSSSSSSLHALGVVPLSAESGPELLRLGAWPCPCAGSLI